MQRLPNPSPPYRWSEAGLELRLRVVPRAAKTEFAGATEEGYRVRLAAPPVEGKANACLVDFLANAFGVPRAQVEILSGGHSRTKTVRIQRPTQSPFPELPIEAGRPPPKSG